MAKSFKAPVSERALFARLNRALAKQGESLKRCRADTRSHLELGNYFIVGDGNAVTAKHVDIAALAREMEVLKDYEELKDA